MEIRRDEYTNKAYVWAIETITPGSELTVQYGPDYWQEHFFSCPDTVQQAATQCYGLHPIAGQCYQAKELRRLRSNGLAHQARGVWYLGPKPHPTPRINPGSHPRQRACVPLPALAQLPQHPTVPTRREIPPLVSTASDAPSTTSQTPATTLPVVTVSPAPLDTTPPASLDTPLSTPAHSSADTPFLWLMDIAGSIVDHSVQATWGVTALLNVAAFLSDPSHCNMGSLLSWASAYGSPARFHLYHAPPSHSCPTQAHSALGLLAADYGLKARSASGIRGEDTDDWPCVTEPSDLDLLRSHLRQLTLRPNLDAAARDLLAAGLSADSPSVQLLPTGRTLLGLGDPRLPYTLFEPPQRGLDSLGNLLPLLLTGDPRLPFTRDHAWTDLQLISSDPNYGYWDPPHGLLPLSTHNPSREGERTRWALHSLCQATVEAMALPPTRLRRPPRGRGPLPPAEEPTPIGVLPTSPRTPPSPPVLSQAGPPPLPLPTVSDDPPAPTMREAAMPHPKPLHTGIPPSSPWSRARSPPTYGTLWSSLQCGPNHVALAGYTTSHSPNLRVGTLNTNGLTTTKLTEILL